VAASTTLYRIAKKNCFGAARQEGSSVTDPSEPTGTRTGCDTTCLSRWNIYD